MTPNNLVLVIENNTSIQELYALAFESRGFDVLIADHCQLGINTVTLRQPNIIVLDLTISKIDGLTFLKKLQQNFNYKPIIVVVSNLANSKVKKEVMELGADRLVPKADIHPSQIVNEVLRAMKTRRQKAL